MLDLKDSKSLLLGSGALFVGSPPVNMGLLKGDVSFEHTVDIGEVKGGFPQTVVKKYKEGEKAVLNASIAELDKENIQLLLGGRLTGGGTEELPEVSPVVFRHEREGDSVLVLTIHKAKVVSGFKPKFSETGLALADLQIEAVADTTKPKGEQLYKIDIYAVKQAKDESLGTGDGSTTTFSLAHKPVLETAEIYLTLDGVPVQASDFTLNAAEGEITFTTAPESGKAIVITYWYQEDA